MNEYNQIIAICNENIVIDNNSTNAYLERAKAKKLSQDYQGAIADYDRAIEIDPYSIQSYFDRARDKDNLSDYQGAISDYLSKLSRSSVNRSTISDRKARNGDRRSIQA